MTTSQFRIAAIVLLATIPLCAHDMWLEPTTFFPAAGQIIGAHLRVGQDLLGDPLPRQESLIREFIVEDSEGRRALVGHEGADPAGLLRAGGQGLLVVGYFSHPSSVDLPAATFNRYLKEEGLDSIAALRDRRGQSGANTRELFTRCAKSLILSGDSGLRQADRRLGFTLELIAERNPYLLHPGDSLPVLLTYQDRPLAGALVVAMNRRNPAEKVSARTGADGRVRLPLRAEGMWMIKAVHMIPAPSGAGAEWQSFWASLTFEMRSAMSARK